MSTEPAGTVPVVDPAANDAVRVATDLYSAFGRGDIPAVPAPFDPAMEN